MSSASQKSTHTPGYISETVKYGLSAMDESVRPVYAAAPMLLAALEELANAALDCKMRGHNERNATVLAKFEDNARAAIRAAKGESNG